jgi:thioredoxin 1
MALEITDGNFQELVLNSDKLTVLDFWAPWCGPCKAIGPIIEELSKEYDGKANIGKVDVDNNQEVTLKYNVRNIPTIVFVKGGTEVYRQVGASGKAVLQAKINELI